MNHNEYIDLAFSSLPNLSLLGSKMHYLAKIATDIAVQNLSGDVVECGVYKGGSARLLATIFSNKNVLLFDSFEGMKESDQIENGHRKGDFSDISLSEVQNYLADKTNCSFFPGWLPNSASHLTDEEFCFVHLDLDLYQSTRQAIEIFWPRLVPNGAMVFDDWEWIHCPGVKQSITEYFGADLSKYRHSWDGNMCVLYKPETTNNQQ